MTKARKVLRAAIAEERLDPELDEFVRVNVEAFTVKNDFSIEKTLELRAQMEHLLKDESLSIGVKSLLAYEGRYFNVAKLWSYKHFSGYPLEELVSHYPLSREAALTTAKNENHTLNSVNLLLTNSSDPVKAFTEIFVASLNEKSFREALGALFKYRKALDNGDTAVMDRARKLYNIDETVPDEWVERMLG